MKYCLLLLSALFSISVLSAQDGKQIDWLNMSAKGLSPAQLRLWERAMNQFLQKSAGSREEVKSLVIQGNNIKTIVYNYASISRPGVSTLDLQWNGLGYAYEFGPLVGARVKDAKKAGSLDSTEFKIVSEGFYRAREGEYGPDGTKWGWLPKTGYAAPNQNDIASWGARSAVNNDLRLRPPSWPESWYNATLGRYVWPAFLGADATTPDEEVYFVVDDYTKREFAYYPFPSDSTKRGLGVNLECRMFQFQNPLAGDIIFLVYTVENPSQRILPEVYFGMFGDPHVGGANNYSDDAASFIPALAGKVFKNGQDLAIVNGVLTSQRARNLVYAWDPDGKSDIPTIKPGYFGYKFLESPDNSNDGIDNDDDGLVDESPFNDKGVYIDGTNVPLTTGIADLTKYKAVYGNPKPRWSGDEDGDWDATRDDVGLDGIASTKDEGEGNGVPDGKNDPVTGDWLGSEPNFGFRDVHESDQIGLRSFWALDFNDANNVAKNDVLMFNSMSSDTSDVSLLYPPVTQDNIFLYGSGPFTLHRGDRQRFSIALMMGADLNDLMLNSEVAQRVLEANYRFAQPPPKPVVTAVPGNGRVTLYWDISAEEGVDALSGVNDFEGYKIYRSEDYTFSDVFTVTDGNGHPFIGKALFDVKAQRLAQWHLPWSDSLQSLYQGGFHPAEYPGRYVKYYMGEPSDVSGLRHEYIDSTVTNGKTYYYAVVSFDHGIYNVSFRLPPTESQSTILRDPVTQEFKFDVNTVSAVPNASATGLISFSNDIENGSTTIHTAGPGTGKLKLQVLSEQALGNNNYSLRFTKAKVGADSVLTYNVLRETPTTEKFLGKDTSFVNLIHKYIVASSVQVFDNNGIAIPANFLVTDSLGGQIRANTPGKLLAGMPYSISYQYYPVVGSTNFQSQDANPVFDGIRPFVGDDPLGIDRANSGFNKPTNIRDSVLSPTIGTAKFAPLDVKLVFNKLDTNATGSYEFPGDTLTNNTFTTKVVTPFKITNATDTTKLTVFVVTPKTGNRWSFGDKLIVLTPPPYKVAASNTMLEIRFELPVDTTKKININGGETYLARMKKPFGKSDAFTFTTKKVSYDKELARKELDNVFVVPNPYVVTSQFEQPTNRSDLRGDRVIQFRNLPVECTIYIYTITGELVRTLYKNDTNGYLNWDVLSSESARIGYGVYIYYVGTPAGGSKIGRLAIIK